ncbi:IQ motif and SEC7 domain-containing protein 1 isoform X2 [Cylas formicarius]|nr:IQ motif and SEC7 domain-containing protein 1 isoform X2 [Cylas formicarius]XP_060537255.1 IQ motif and SEC7 domain-containing protein 1 isoform X2 [Cylas formicarius]XP_060537256.1 IQ motif and SEC7 domain-containing protein 1 isoform X2 [Cylas formicarius]XP_060537257.1 IQ motif and SEC7 domain-containing protein 1 isoform X2 [Cylas formicarius]XP_060537258.1 IQ motif and SEC7 domain-containing protein 1 isoform X2 [Cylas formicarius]
MRGHLSSSPTSAPGGAYYRYLPNGGSRHNSPARGGHTVTTVNDLCDRTIVRVRRSGMQQERIRVVCTTRRQHVSRLVTVSDVCHNLPPLRKHVTVISFPQKLERSQVINSMGSSDHMREQTYIQAPNYIQTQNYSTPAVSPVYCRPSPNNPSYGPGVQQLHKKGSLRNGDILKRSRVQTTYELSQDILDKQIEVLERKYGGIRARNAALTIQRAFRRYTLLKKFAAITAMAKAEKRISRRLPPPNDECKGNMEVEQQCPEYMRNSYEGHECNNIRALPVRSMSLRERRNIDNMPIPRSQSGTPTVVCWENYSSSSSLQHYYSPTESKVDSLSSTVTASPSSCSTPTTSSNGYMRARSISSRKVPPEVPKRTSSITSRSIEQGRHKSNGLSKNAENGSLSSVQSSGSDSSISTERIQCEFSGSPVWKRKGNNLSEYAEPTLETSLGNISNASSSTYTLVERTTEQQPAQSYKISETIRKRQYRVGLNLFNKKPERGIAYLIRRGFLENSPQGVARFLISRKGLSKQMIGEYLGNLQNPFCMAVLECFAAELDLSGMQVDVALRKFQQHFRMPGEAQKIERLMEIFSQRYCQCNVDIVARLRSPDTIFVLAFAIIMLNTDLHTPNIKAERRMKLEDFIKNLRGIDDCGDIDSDMLTGVYERVKANEFKPGSDHVTQVMKVQATIVGKKPNMALPHRRLVCYCRLYEIPDVNKKERPGVHQREVFLFNDLLVITKILSKKKSSVTYTFRNSYPLCGMIVTLFEVPHYPYGIKLSQRVDQKVLVTFNARNEHDRCKFAEDLKEAVSEMDEMENLRIEAELERQKSNRANRSGSENRDSGVADVEVCPCQCPCSQNQAVGTNDMCPEEVAHDAQIKRSALSNSLLDIHEQFAGDKAQRRGSVGSLDSGMSVSFQSTSASTCSRSDKLAGKQNKQGIHNHQGFLGGLFNKRQAAGNINNAAKSTEV